MVSHCLFKREPKLIKTKQNQTAQNKKFPTKCSKFKCNTVSIRFSACWCSLVIISSKGEKKRVRRQFFEWLSDAVAHLPAAASLLLLEALFMQILGVSLTITWPRRLCLLRLLLGAMPLLLAFPFPSTLGDVTLHQLSQADVFIYSSHGK
jgi:hypothetical protein